MTKMPDALLALIGTYIDHYVANLDSFRILCVWRQVLGFKRRTTSDAQLFNAPYLELLAEKLDRAVGTGLVRTTLPPREIVATAWLAAHGVVSIVSSTGLPAGKVHFSVQELRDAVSRMLAQSFTTDRAP